LVKNAASTRSSLGVKVSLDGVSRARRSAMIEVSPLR
jgi:hypothetical protein